MTQVLPPRPVRGSLLRRGDEGYEQARLGAVFNARRPDRYPAAVLLAADEADVVAGVQLARAEGLRVAVRAGGHSWAVWSVRDDTLLIDLGRLRDIEYDEATGIAAVGPAVRGGTELAPVLTERGRAFPGGHCQSVGLGGFLLQGGQGWNSRAWGWACEHIAAVDVVTANGRLVHADDRQNSDLYWAARGSGPGFPGIVTRFYLRTHERPAAMVQDTWTFRLEDAAPLLTWLHEVLPTLDVSVEPVLAATRLPGVPLDDGPRPEGTVLLLHTTVMGPSVDHVHQLLAPFDACPLAGRRLGHVRGETSIVEENTSQTLQNPESHRYVVPGPTPARTSSPRCCTSSGRSCRPSTPSRSGTAGHRRDRYRTWPSPSRATFTWPRMRSTRRRPTTRGTATGCTGGQRGSPGWARGSTSATPTSPGAGTAFCRTWPTGGWRPFG